MRTCGDLVRLGNQNTAQRASLVGALIVLVLANVGVFVETAKGSIVSCGTFRRVWRSSSAGQA